MINTIFSSIKGIGVLWILRILNAVGEGETDDGRPRLLLLAFTRMAANIS